MHPKRYQPFHVVSLALMTIALLTLSLGVMPSYGQQVRIDGQSSAEQVNPAEDPGAQTLFLQQGVTQSLSEGHASKNAGMVLWDNGPLVNSPGTGSGGADESVLQNVTLGMNILGFGHQVAFSNRVADDFTITDAAGWNIEKIFFYAYQTGSPTTSTITAVNYQIWDGLPGGGGTVIYGNTVDNRLDATGFSNIYRVTETTGGATNRPIMEDEVEGPDADGVTLPAGTYWIDWQSDGSLGSGPWAPPVTINGSSTTGDGLQSLDNGVTWAPVVDVGGQDFPFIIYGTLGGTDLALDKYGDVDLETLTGSFHLEVSNLGPGPATDVEVLDNMPPELSIDGWETSQGIFDPFTGIWTVGDLDADSTAWLWIDVTFESIGLYVNEAWVSSGSIDLDPSNNYAEVSLFLQRERDRPDYVSGLGPGRIIERGGRRFSSDLTVGKAVDNTAPAVGATVVYTVTVTNNGPQNNAGIEVTDHLPDCLINTTWTTTQGAYDGWIWNLGKLKVGDSATLTVTAEVGPNCSDTITNTAGVSAANLPDPDDDFFDFDNPVEGDNVASADITISSSPDARAETTALLANYPNPFNPETVIPFALKESGAVKLAVYDLLGRQVQLLVDDQLSSGRYEVTFRGDQLPTGVYLVRLEAQGVVQTQRITLLK